MCLLLVAAKALFEVVAFQRRLAMCYVVMNVVFYVHYK